MTGLRRGAIAELPYYRADPPRWAATVGSLAAAGVATVSAYVPWRFHEVTPGRFDLDGRTDPQRDLVRFAGLVADAGMDLLAKPGPFVHAELPFGGLPDRFAGPPHVALAWLPGSTSSVSYLGQRFPSPADEGFAAESERWITAVHAAIGHLDGLVVQVGNEGTVGERAGDLATIDASTAGLARLRARWPGRARAICAVAGGGAADLHAEVFAEVADDALDRAYRGWSSNRQLTNVRPPTWGAGPGRLEAWVLRNRPGVGGHTDWVGDVVHDDGALAAQLFAARWLGGPNVERNWGLDLADRAFDPGAALYGALVDLAAGVATQALYPAVATDAWLPCLDVDPAEAAAHGEDPAVFRRPYGPGAPWTDGGGAGRRGSHAAATALLGFLARLGPWWTPTSAVVTGTVPIDLDALATGTAGPDDLEHRFGRAVAEMLRRPGTLITPVPRRATRPVPAAVPTSVRADGPCLAVAHAGPDGQLGLVALSRTDDPLELVADLGGLRVTARLTPRGGFAVAVEAGTATVLWHAGHDGTGALELGGSRIDGTVHGLHVVALDEPAATAPARRPLRPFDAIAVDFYDTIATAAPSVPRWESFLEARGYHLDPEALARFGDTAVLGARTPPTEAAFHAEVEARRRALFAACGVARGDVDGCLADARAWDAAYEVEPLADALDGLAALRRLGVPLVLASNWGWDLQRHLEALGIGRWFHAVVCSSQVGVQKPHPGFYRLVARRAHATPDRILFLGDGPETDVAGPRRAGMAAVHVTPGSPPLPRRAPLGPASPSLLDVAQTLVALWPSDRSPHAPTPEATR